MKIYIVTVRRPRDPSHDPYRKKTGECIEGMLCTDVTGEHHSMLVAAKTRELAVDVAKFRGFSHVTRIEEVPREEVELVLES